MREEIFIHEAVIAREILTAKTDYGTVKLNYELIKNAGSGGEKSFFDIRIQTFKKRETREFVLDYEEKTLGITEDEAYAKELFSLMVREMVMPESLLCVIDDLMYFR